MDKKMNKEAAVKISQKQILQDQAKLSTYTYTSVSSLIQIRICRIKI